MMRRSRKGTNLGRHGHTSGGISPTYHSWTMMIQRCTNPRHENWEHYGGKGVSVHPPWMEFANFLADMGPRPDGLTLDRDDSHGNYEPGNCRWATASRQQRNKRNTKYYAEGDRSMCLSDWADELGISKELAHYRFKKWGTFQKGRTWQLLQKSG